MRKRQRLMVIFVLLTLIGGFSCGFGAWTVAVNVFQSAGPPNSPQVLFVIRDGETTAQIADELQAKGIIRNALAFRLWARYENLDRRLQAGAYQLSASMTIPEIVQVFLSASPIEFWVTIPEGNRIWQIAKHFATRTELVKFKSDEFIKIAQTGTYTDAAGKTVSLASQYWFLKHGQQDNSPPKFVLEGYLFPDSYLVPLDASAADVIKLMLNNFGERLCPGPPNQLDAYLNNEQQCVAHGRIDPTTHQNIFDLLKKHYSDADGKSLADKLYHALTLASIVEREAKTHDDRQGIASVYYKRYLVSKNEFSNPPDPGLSLLQADPTLQYALGTPDQPWPQLQQAGNTYQLGPYDTYQHPGLPPGPICSPGEDALAQAINPPDTRYFYFITGKDGATHYANNYQEHQENINKYGLP